MSIYYGDYNWLNRWFNLDSLDADQSSLAFQILVENKAIQNKPLENEEWTALIKDKNGVQYAAVGDGPLTSKNTEIIVLNCAHCKVLKQLEAKE